MKIGFRTVKTAIGTTISVFLAQALELDFFSSAGMLTILCIQATRKQSFETAIARFFACLVALIASSLFFKALGQQPIVIGLVLLIVIPVTVRFKIAGGIGTSSVIMLHLYNAPTIDWALMVNEVILVTVGIGVALAVNFYMPNADKELEDYQKRVERHFQLLFKMMAQALRGENVQCSETEIKKTEQTIKNARRVALREVRNHLLHHSDTYYEYFSAAEKQLDIIKRVAPIVNSLSSTYEQNYMIANFLESITFSTGPESTGTITLLQLQEMRQQFRDLPLPETIEEFETRAYLMQLVYEMEQYLLIKRAYKGYTKSIMFNS